MRVDGVAARQVCKRAVDVRRWWSDVQAAVRARARVVGISTAIVLVFGMTAVLPAQAQAPAAQVDAGGAGAPGTAGKDRAALPRGAGKAERRATPGNLMGHGGPIKAIAVDRASGRALTGSFDYAMMVWDVTGEVPRELARLDQHDGAVNAVAFVSPAEGVASTQALAAGDDGHLSLWDLDGQRRAHRFEGHQAKIVGLAVSQDGRWAATASWDRTARLWDLKARVAGPVLEGHTGPVNAVAFSGDGQSVFTGSADGQIREFRARDGALVRPVHRHGWGVNVLLRLPGSERLVFGSINGDAAVLDTRGGGTVTTLPAASRPILALAAVEKPGLLAVGSGDGMVRVVRLADGSLIEIYQNPFGPVWALAFRDGGTSLYYGGLDDFATLWRISPRADFEPVDTAFPRRFQVSGTPDDAVAQGEIQFARKCSVCHTLEPDGANRAGPTLHGIFGRRIATLPGYPFSEPLKGLDIVWTAETVSKLFELGPEVFTPGSKMPLQKMTDARQRANLIAYLKAASGPPPSPAVDGARAAGQGRENTGDGK